MMDFNEIRIFNSIKYNIKTISKTAKLMYSENKRLFNEIKRVVFDEILCDVSVDLLPQDFEDCETCKANDLSYFEKGFKQGFELGFECGKNHMKNPFDKSQQLLDENIEHCDFPARENFYNNEDGNFLPHINDKVISVQVPQGTYDPMLNNCENLFEGMEPPDELKEFLEDQKDEDN